MFISWWLIVLVALLLGYLIIMNAHLHRRVTKLEKVLRRLEGISEEDLKKQIRDRMLQNDDGRE